MARRRHRVTAATRQPRPRRITLAHNVLDLRLLATFYWVVTLGGFRKAAERLNTTQPAVSSRVTQLEQAVGHRLLDRDRGRGAAPTPIGLQLFDYAERLLRLADEISAKLVDPTLQKGTVRLGVSETLSHLWLADLLREVARRFPQVAIDVTVDISPAMAEALAEGEIDVALLLGPVERPDVANLPLCAYPLDFMVGARSPLASEGETIETICANPLITFPRATRPFQQIKASLKAAGVAEARIFGNTSILSIVRMTLDGIGIGILPSAAVGALLDDGRLRIVRSTFALPELRYTASFLDIPGNTLAATVAHLARTIADAASDIPSAFLFGEGDQLS